MLYSYLTLAVRNLLRNKGYSAISIFGLSVGMTCCVLVALFVQDEFLYDAFHKDGDRIYRVVSEIRKQDGTRNAHIGTSGPLGPLTQEALPEVEDYLRVFMAPEGVWFRINDQLSMERYCLTDPNVFDFFSFPLLKGDAKTVLKEPFAAVISESLAHKHFGDQNPVGQIITIESQDQYGEYQVMGVMKDVPEQSTLQMDFVTATVRPGAVGRVWNSWHELSWWRPLRTFVKVKADASVQDLESALSNLVLESTNTGIQLRNEKSELRYYLQPLTRMRLYAYVDYGIARSRNDDIQRVYLLSAIAFFVLVIACVNFMNLATARSIRRAREVGVRKVVGAYRGGLIQQFLSESVLVALLAFVFSVLLSVLVLPAFNEFVGKSLSLLGNETIWWFVGGVCCAVFVGIIAGCVIRHFICRHLYLLMF